MSVADTLSIQLYSLRNDGDLDRILDIVAGHGFRRVETIGGHLVDAKATRRALDSRGLSAPTGHVGLPELRERFDWVVEQAKTVGIEDLYMPAVPADERDAPAERWKAVGAELGEMAERMAKAGIRLGYHNHHWELTPFPDGTRPLEHLFDSAAGSGLSWEADIAWLVRGHVDPVPWLERYRPLLTAIHVKDIAPAGQNVDEDGWADVGHGTLDWPRLWREAASRGARHMVLEHDKPKDGGRFAQASRGYLLEALA